MRLLLLLVLLTTGCVSVGDYEGESDDVINEQVLTRVTIGPTAAAATPKIKTKSQCIHLVHQLDNPDAYAYAVNFYPAACTNKQQLSDNAVAFTLRLDPPLDLQTSRDYVLIAEDLSTKAEAEAWIPVGVLKVTTKGGKVRKATLEALCSESGSKNYASTCELEISAAGTVTNLALRASGNAIGLNHAID